MEFDGQENRLEKEQMPSVENFPQTDSHNAHREKSQILKSDLRVQSCGVRIGIQILNIMWANPHTCWIRINIKNEAAHDDHGRGKDGEMEGLKSEIRRYSILLPKGGQLLNGLLKGAWKPCQKKQQQLIPLASAPELFIHHTNSRWRSNNKPEVSK